MEDSENVRYENQKFDSSTMNNQNSDMNIGEKQKSEEKKFIPKIEKQTKTQAKKTVKVEASEVFEKSKIIPIIDKTDLERKINFGGRVIFINAKYLNAAICRYIKRYVPKQFISKILHKLHQKFDFEKIIVFGKRLRPFNDEFKPIEFTNHISFERNLKFNRKNANNEIICISNSNYRDVTTFSSETFLSSIFEESSNEEKDIETFLQNINEEKMEDILNVTKMKMKIIKKEEVLENVNSVDEKNIKMNSNLISPKKEEFEINFLKEIERKKLFEKTSEIKLNTRYSILINSWFFSTILHIGGI